ncbi:MAG: DUF2269 domain-containing protein [Corynebacterium sp.]|nr:DUF2269 domain-containing protein [Corynebacterium sp.]
MNLVVVLHVIAAILFLGPVTVAVSAFGPAILGASQGDELSRGRALSMYKITRTYGLLSLIIPILGLAAMFTDGGYWSEWRFHVSILLSVIAWALLFFVIAPKQNRAIQALDIHEPGEESPAERPQISDWNKVKGQSAMFGGIFSLLWVIVAIFMLVSF